MLFPNISLFTGFQPHFSESVELGGGGGWSYYCKYRCKKMYHSYFSHCKSLFYFFFFYSRWVGFSCNCCSLSFFFHNFVLIYPQLTLALSLSFSLTSLYLTLPQFLYILPYIHFSPSYLIRTSLPPKLPSYLIRTSLPPKLILCLTLPQNFPPSFPKPTVLHIFLNV